MHPPARLLALNWPTDQPPAIVHRIMGDRVLARGDNHQSLRADIETKAHEDVIWLFITQKEELEDNEADSIVEMSIEDTLEQAVHKAVDGCVEVLSLERPTQAKIDEAIQVALGYAPKTKKADDKKASKSVPRYFGLLPELDLIEALGPQLSAQADHAFWDDLVKRKTITKRPHVTITHNKSLPAESELWERCMVLHRTQHSPLFKFKLGYVVWNSRVMAATVDEIELADGLDADQIQEGSEFISKLPHDVRNRLHITVGTKDQSVPPVEAMTLVDAWRKGPAVDGVGSVDLKDVDGMGRVKGLF